MSRSVRRGAVGAAVLAVVAVTVYQGRVLLGNETGAVELARGERGELQPGEAAPSRSLARKAPASAPAARRAWARRLASREARQELLRMLRRARERREQPAVQSPAPLPGGGAGGTTQAPATGTLDKEYIRSTINEGIPLVKECYELALREHPKLDGLLKVRFTIIAEPEVGGLVEQVEIEGQDPAALDPTLRECVEQTVYSLEFPPPEGGGRVNVTYPFRFSSGKGDSPQR